MRASLALGLWAAYSANEPDHLGAVLFGSAALFVGTLASVPIALSQWVTALGTPHARDAGRLRTLWLVCGVVMAIGAMFLLASPDPLVVPFLPGAVLLPFANTAVAWRVHHALSEGAALRISHRAGLLLAPLAWLGLLAYFVVAVFPKT